MACEVCEHCNAALSREEAVVRNGYSYHANCHKCYVCSETNLQNADIFKGVIFCSGCSNRIFQGCSTARHKGKSRRLRIPAYKQYREREKRRYDKGYNKYANHVLEMARLTATDSRSCSAISKEFKTSTPTSTVATALTNHTYQMQNSYKVPKYSAEIGTTTTVTKELLKEIHSPIEVQSKFITPVKPHKKSKSRRDKKCKNCCSDLRVAELGISTEIAHVALRRPSEVPVIIKSETSFRPTVTQSSSNLTRESNISAGGELKHSNFSEYSDLTNGGFCLNRTIGSLIKLPYKSFKRNILNRSSLISFIVNTPESECILNRFRILFQHEITDHQRRGLKMLFSTINSRKQKYKLGWLDVMHQIPEDDRLPNMKKKREKRCNHFKHSHSYRCMRTQVMKLAGPTKSELAVLRKKLKNAFCLNLCKGFRNFNEQYVDILTSVACGQSRRDHAPSATNRTDTLTLEQH